MAYFSQTRARMVQALIRSLRGCFEKEERVLLILVIAAAFSVTTSELNRRPTHWHRRSAHHAPRAKQPPIPVPEFFQRWRQSYLTVNRESDRLGLVRGIFLGDDSSLSPEVRVLFRNAGLSHLLAASGYNCWIVALVFGLFILLILNATSGLLPARLVLRARRFATPCSRVFGAWLFWLWTDQSPPITRSVTLISAKFTLDALGFAAPFARLLSAQYLCSLIWVPSLWHSASFQLTFGCLFGIIWVPPLFERFRPRHGGYVDAIWDYFATSTGAVLGTIPTTWLVFDEINFSSLTTNWFAVPPVSFAIMPLGLLTILLLLPGLDLAEHSFFRALIDGLALAAAQVAALLHGALVFWVKYTPSLRLD